MSNLLLASMTDGMLSGIVYGLAAMGLTLIFGVMNVINLAHGPIIALGMFGLYLLYTVLGINPLLGLLIVAVGGLIFGVGMYFIAVNRVINAPHLSSLLSTYSVNMIIIGVGTAVFSTSFRNIDYSLGAFTFGPINVTGNRLGAALVALLVTALLYLFLYRTRHGKYIRAVANNRSSAELMGISSVRTLALAFGIGTHAGRRVGRADRHLAALHDPVGRRLRAQELRDRGAGRAGQPTRRPGWRRDPRAD